MIGFIGYSRIGYFQSRYIPRLSEASAFHDIRNTINQNESVLTNDNYLSHLSARSLANSVEADYLSLENYDYVVLPAVNNYARIGGKLRPVKDSKLEPKIQKALLEAKNVGMKCSFENAYIRLCKKK